MKTLTEAQIKRLPASEQVNVFLSRMGKIPALMEHYKIEVGTSELCFARLAFKLACDFVPGFSVVASKKKKRAKNKRTRS